MFNPSEDLLARLRDVDKYPEVCDAIWEFMDGQDEGLSVDSDLQGRFFQPDDMHQYYEARSWWPHVLHLPPKFNFPTLFELVSNYKEAGTFIERLVERARAVDAWVKEHNPKSAPPLVPGESKEDRAKRLGKERVQRHRAKLQSKDTELDSIPAVAAAKAHWEACKVALSNAERATVAARSAYMQARAAATVKPSY